MKYKNMRLVDTEFAHFCNWSLNNFQEESAASKSDLKSVLDNLYDRRSTLTTFYIRSY